MKGIIPQGKPCTHRLRRLSATRRGMNPFFSSLAQPCPCKHGHGLAPFVNQPFLKFKRGIFTFVKGKLPLSGVYSEIWH
jgi:hypothetical protein